MPPQNTQQMNPQIPQQTPVPTQMVSSAPDPKNPITPQPKQPVDIKKGHKIAANLGFATTLSQMALQKMNPPKQQLTTPQNSPQMPPEPTQTSEPKEDTQTQMKGLETRIMAQLEALKKDLKPKDKNEELESLKQEIQEVLNEQEG